MTDKPRTIGWIKMANHKAKQLGTLKERMKYVMEATWTLYDKLDAKNEPFDHDLWNGIFDLQTIVDALPCDFKFDKTGRRVNRKREKA